MRVRENPVFSRWAAFVSLMLVLGTVVPGAALAGDYLGQKLPGAEPVLFAPGIVSTGMAERDIAMTPDGNEIYFTILTGRYDTWTILVTRRAGSRWSKPEVVPFSGDPRFRDGEPCVAPDGKKLYFVSNRPLAGGEKAGAEHIWVADRAGQSWSPPRPAGPPINGEWKEYFPSVTRDGTLYFTREDLKTQDSSIYRARWVDGAFAPPERLPDRVNAGAARFNAFITPDESCLIYCLMGREDSLGGIDYYAAFRSPEDAWSEPVNLGARINTAGSDEYSPYLSPDGKVFFFMSARPGPGRRAAGTRFTWAGLQRSAGLPGNGNSDIWWMDATFLTGLQPATPASSAKASGAANP